MAAPDTETASPWLLPGLFVQHPDTSIHDLLPHLPPRKHSETRRRYTHIVNLFRPPEQDRVLELTARSMRIAKQQAQCDVRLVNVQDEAEDDATPPDFERATPLTRSTLTEYPDVAKRRLPFLFDILTSGAEGVPADDYVIYTNADIYLRPSFYNFVDGMIDRGFDAVIINRRDVPEDLMDRDNEGLEDTHQGVLHGGFDCFVFRRGLLDEFEHNMVCIGVPFIGWSLMFNMFAKARKCALFTNPRLTYHFGDDERPVTNENADLRLRNAIEAQSFAARLLAEPYAEKVLATYCEYVDRIDRPRQKVPIEIREVLAHVSDRDTYARKRASDLGPDPKAVSQVRSHGRQRLFLHIGMPKTATTSIQTVIDGNRDAFAADGLIFTDFCKMPSRVEDGFEDIVRTVSGRRPPHPMKLLALACLPKALRDFGLQDADAVRRFIRAHLDDAARDPAADVLLSHESLAGSDVNLGTLARIVDGFDVTIVMSIRRFDDWLESRYRQALREAPNVPENTENLPFIRRWMEFTPEETIERVRAALPEADVLLLDYASDVASGALVSRFFTALGHGDVLTKGPLSESFSEEAARENTGLSSRSDAFLQLLAGRGLSGKSRLKVSSALRTSQHEEPLRDTKRVTLLRTRLLVQALQTYNTQVPRLRARYGFPGDVAQPRQSAEYLRQLPVKDARDIMSCIAPALPAEVRAEVDQVLRTGDPEANLPATQASPRSDPAARPRLIILAGQLHAPVPAFKNTPLHHLRHHLDAHGIAYADFGEGIWPPHDPFFRACAMKQGVADVKRRLDSYRTMETPPKAVVIDEPRLLFPETDFAQMAELTEGYDVSVLAFIRRTDVWAEDHWQAMLHHPAEMKKKPDRNHVFGHIEEFVGLEILRRARHALPHATIKAFDYDSLADRSVADVIFEGLSLPPSGRILSGACAAKSIPSNALSAVFLREARRAGAPMSVIQSFVEAINKTRARLMPLQNSLEPGRQRRMTLLPRRIRQRAFEAYVAALPDLEKEFGLVRATPVQPLKSVGYSRPDLTRARWVFNLIAPQLPSEAIEFAEKNMGFAKRPYPRLSPAEPKRSSDGSYRKKVVSFSLFGDNPVYQEGARANILACREFYPDWTCRIYVSDRVFPVAAEALKDLGAELIMVKQHTDQDGLAWRFLAASDPEVDLFICRDLDATVNLRDRKAVDDWLATDKAFHVIRDHPGHQAPMLAGLWGARWQTIPDLEQVMADYSRDFGSDYYGWDMDFLARCVYPVARSSLHVNSEFVYYEGEAVHSIPHERDGDRYLGLPDGRGDVTELRMRQFAARKSQGLQKVTLPLWAR